MKLKIPNRFRYRLAGFSERELSRTELFFARGVVYLSLLAMAVPIKAAHEIVHGPSVTDRDLKSVFRCVLWLWNRSWIPLKFPLGTFFDVGWILSESTSLKLKNRSFLSKNPISRKCDIAQYTLSSIHEALVNGEQNKVVGADHELVEQLTSVFSDAHKWLDVVGVPDKYKVDAEVISLEAEIAKHDSFHNEITISALIDFDQLCSDIDQEYFLVSGTFLGAVRDGAFIGYDHDIDLGVFEDRLSHKLLPALQQSSNFRVSRVDHVYFRQTEGINTNYELSEQPILIRIAHQSGVSIDIFIHFYEDDLVWHGTSAQRWDNRNFTLKDFPFLDRTFKGAENFDLYLTENYGENWRIPQSDFDSNFDTPNINFINSANGLVFFAWLVSQSVLKNRPERVQRYLGILKIRGAIEPFDGKLHVK